MNVDPTPEDRDRILVIAAARFARTAIETVEALDGPLDEKDRETLHLHWLALGQVLVDFDARPAWTPTPALVTEACQAFGLDPTSYVARDAVVEGLRSLHAAVEAQAEEVSTGGSTVSG